MKLFIKIIIINTLLFSIYLIKYTVLNKSNILIKNSINSEENI